MQALVPFLLVMGEQSGAAGGPGVLLTTPPPEVLGTVLSQRHGPLPCVAPIIRLRRGPTGGFEAEGDLAGVLERRRAANAKERERVRPPPKKKPHPPPQNSKQIDPNGAVTLGDAEEWGCAFPSKCGNPKNKKGGGVTPPIFFSPIDQKPQQRVLGTQGPCAPRAPRPQAQQGGHAQGRHRVHPSAAGGPAGHGGPAGGTPTPNLWGWLQGCSWGGCNC